MPANGVVQYVVWGIHDRVPQPVFTKDDVIFEQGAFKNPKWYGNVDLNKTYGTVNEAPAEPDSKTPYYFIYSCPPGSVWFNEIWHHYNTSKAYDYSDGRPSWEFIELAGKTGTDISGWKINVYRQGDPEPFITLPDNAEHCFEQGRTIPNDTNDGWGFVVLGDEGITNAAGDIVVDYGVPLTEPRKRDTFGSNYNLGFELLRSGGIIEQAVCVTKSSEPNGDYPFDLPTDPDALSRWVSQPYKSTTTRGLSYSLVDDVTGDMLWVNGEEIYGDYAQKVVAYTNSLSGKVWWWFTVTPTPGEKNVGQTIPSSAFVDEYRLISVINRLGAYGTHNGRTETINITVNSGSSTSIVYVANQWYKIASLKSNGNDIAGAIGKSSYTFNVNSMSGNVSNNVTFVAKTAEDFPLKNWTNAILDWFRRRGWTEDEIDGVGDTGDGDEYTIPEEYLMDTSPLLTTVADAKTDSISFDGDILTLGVGLVRADGCTTNTLDAIGSGTPVTSGINGVVNIYGVANLADFGKSETKIASAQIPAGSFNGTNRVDKSFNIGSLGLNFFKWKLEEE